MTPPRATLTLLSPGLCTLVVDHGRPRSRSLGVPVGGAADRYSLALGNALVGNAPDAAALEVGLLGPTLEADAPLACVLYGAPFALRTDRQEVSAGTTFTLLPGERLHIGGTPRRARAYFCVQGGVDTPLILDSRSSLAPLKAGDQLTCASGTIGRRSIDAALMEEPSGKLRILPAAQADWFPPAVLTRDAPRFEVTAASNRMGLRLRGPALPVPAREMVSEPVCPGTVQVTRDGQCIVLGADGQTIGGYPKIAHVIRADLDALGQLRPGDRITFETITLEQAEELARQREAALREWLTRLAVAP
jgi:antagonist of KipI